MKYWMTLIFIVVVVMAVKNIKKSAEPTVSDVEQKLETFLTSNKSGRCSGGVSLNSLSDISIGKFEKGFGGWPVYAAYERVCREENSTFTYNGRDNAKRKIAAAFVRRSASGEVEIFVPELFQQAEREMQEAMDKSFGQN